LAGSAVSRQKLCRREILHNMAAAIRSSTFYNTKSKNMSKKEVLRVLDNDMSDDEDTEVSSSSSDFEEEEPSQPSQPRKPPAAKKRIILEPNDENINDKGKGKGNNSKKKSRASAPCGEQVIDFVRERPSLWNPTTRGRKDKQYADVQWELLAKEILGLEGNFSTTCRVFIEDKSNICRGSFIVHTAKIYRWSTHFRNIL
jgi:hypothetical protein